MVESIQTIPIYERLIQEKDKAIQEKDKAIQEKVKSAQEKERLFERLIEEIKGQSERLIEEKVSLIAEKVSLIAEKDKTMEAIKGQSDAEIRLLTDKLKRSNTDILRISESLCVRGMIEKIEVQNSDARRSDPSLSHVKVWNEILDSNPDLLKGMRGHNDAAKRGNFTATVTEIFRKCSDEIHNQGIDEIPIRNRLFNQNEILVLQALCTVFHYSFKMV